MLLPPWCRNSESLRSPGSVTPGRVPTARNHYLQNRQNLIKGCCATSLLGYCSTSIAQNSCTTPFANCLVFPFLLFSVTGWHAGASVAALTCPCSTELRDVQPWHLIHNFSLPFARWVLPGSPEVWRYWMTEQSDRQLHGWFDQCAGSCFPRAASLPLGLLFTATTAISLGVLDKWFFQTLQQFPKFYGLLWDLPGFVSGLFYGMTEQCSRDWFLHVIKASILDLHLS